MKRDVADGERFDSGDIDNLLATVDSQVWLLATVEWVAGWHSGREGIECPICGNTKEEGHGNNPPWFDRSEGPCSLAAALEGFDRNRLP